MRFSNAIIASVSILSASLTSTAAALRGAHETINKKDRKVLEEYRPYEVDYSSTNACPNGSVSAEVKDDQGNPIVGEDVSFLLVAGGGTDSYTGKVQTDENGVATFDFEASTLDGSSLWCSIAIDNPNDMAPTQNVPCSANVCVGSTPPTSTCPPISESQCSTDNCACETPKTIKINVKEFHPDGLDCFACVLPDYSTEQCTSNLDCDYANSECKCVDADIFPTFICHQAICIPKSGAANGKQCYTGQNCASGNCLYQNGSSREGVCQG